MIGNNHVTIPDLLEPVVGFRSFRAVLQEKRDAWVEKKWRGKEYSPFVEPNEYVTDPSGRLVKNYTAIEKAYVKWQESLGEEIEIHHPAITENTISILSPNQPNHIWTPGVVKAECKVTALFIPEPEPHAAPDPLCSCGLYSYYDAKKSYCGGDMLLAIVTQWGKIEAHSSGMRSEFMEIGALLGAGRIMKILAEDEKWKDVIQFSLDDVSRFDFVKLASEFGSPLPEGMFPKESSGEYYIHHLASNKSLCLSVLEELCK